MQSYLTVLQGFWEYFTTEMRRKKFPGKFWNLFKKEKKERKAKDFALADKIRDEITAMGYTVKENKTGYGNY